MAMTVRTTGTRCPSATRSLSGRTRTWPGRLMGPPGPLRVRATEWVLSAFGTTGTNPCRLAGSLATRPPVRSHGRHGRRRRGCRRRSSTRRTPRLPFGESSSRSLVTHVRTRQGRKWTSSVVDAQIGDVGVNHRFAEGEIEQNLVALAHDSSLDLGVIGASRSSSPSSSSPTLATVTSSIAALAHVRQQPSTFDVDDSSGPPHPEHLSSLIGSAPSETLRVAASTCRTQMPGRRRLSGRATSRQPRRTTRTRRQ